MPRGSPFYQMPDDPIPGYGGYPDYVRGEWTINRPPKYLFVRLDPSKVTITITVGNNGDTSDETVTPAVQYRVVFVPRTALSRDDLKDGYKLFLAWLGGQEICRLSAGNNGQNRTYTDATVVGIPGWFFASSINARGRESSPTSPFPNPMDPDMVLYAIPDDPVLVEVVQTSVPRTDTGFAFYSQLDFTVRPPASESFAGVQFWFDGYMGLGLQAGPYVEPPMPMNDIKATILLNKGTAATVVYCVSVSYGRTWRTDVTASTAHAHLASL